MNQRDQVADHLRRFGGLTQERALVLYGVQQLRTRVLELRRQGWQIDTCTDVYAGTSTPACVGHYVLRQEPGQPPVQEGLGL